MLPFSRSQFIHLKDEGFGLRWSLASLTTLKFSMKFLGVCDITIMNIRSIFLCSEDLGTTCK